MTVARLPGIVDHSLRFLDMFKTLLPSHFHVLRVVHSRSIKTNARQSCALLVHF